MSKFISKSDETEVQATQWFKNGDHPQDDCHMIEGSEGPFLSEGKVVRYFRNPNVPGETKCETCRLTMHVHGWIDGSRNGGHAYTVCPGDWIVTMPGGTFCPCDAEEFGVTYDRAEDVNAASSAG